MVLDLWVMWSWDCRQASVALNVWQPEVIRGRQKEIVEQCIVPFESRIHALEMELRLCKQQILGFEKAHVSVILSLSSRHYFVSFRVRCLWCFCMFYEQKDEKRRLDTAKEELVSMKYHPLRDYTLINGGENESKIKRKKLKICHKGEDLNSSSLLE